LQVYQLYCTPTFIVSQHPVVMESAAEKQKRLIQQEIAKLSGKLYDTD